MPGAGLELGVEALGDARLDDHQAVQGGEAGVLAVLSHRRSVPGRSVGRIATIA